MKPIKQYTVVLICPDYLGDMTNNGLVVCHVQTDSPEDAVTKARDRAAIAALMAYLRYNEEPASSVGDFIAILDDKEAIADKYDFAVGAVFSGWHTNINPE